MKTVEELCEQYGKAQQQIRFCRAELARSPAWYTCAAGLKAEANLRFDDNGSVSIEITIVALRDAAAESQCFTIPKARRLRDWLNKVLRDTNGNE